jgi:hypothetical protein
MKLQGFISVAAAIAMTSAVAACDGSTAPTQPDSPGPRFAKPDNPGGGGGNGRFKGTVTVRFDDTGGAISADGQPLSGENTDEQIKAEGPYTLKYTVHGACSAFPLVDQFDGEPISGNVEITADKQPDPDGGFSINDRVRVVLSNVKIDSDPDHIYRVRFNGLPDPLEPEFDPFVEDIHFFESASETKVVVTDEGITVDQLRKRKRVAVQRCRGEGNYTFFASK